MCRREQFRHLLDGDRFDESDENEQAGDAADDYVENPISMRRFAKQRTIRNLLVVVPTYSRHCFFDIAL